MSLSLTRIKEGNRRRWLQEAQCQHAAQQAALIWIQPAGSGASLLLGTDSSIGTETSTFFNIVVCI